MKRIAPPAQPSGLPSFGDYRRMQAQEPSYRAPEEHEILRKASETVKKSMPEPPLPTIEEGRKK